MFSLFRFLILSFILLSHPIYAASIDDYISACKTKYGSQVSPKLCECLGTKTKDFSEEEFNFFYGLTANDLEEINKGQTTLDTDQRMKVIQLSIMGPSKCVNEQAEKIYSTSKPPSDKNSTSSSSTISDSAASSAK